MKTLKLLLFLLAAMVPFSCRKGGCNVIPDFQFRTPAVSLIQYSKLTVPAGSDTIPGGICGIILINDGTEIRAFDRCSTVNPHERNAVTLDGVLATDPKSGAVYSLMGMAFPVEVAECPLKPYLVQWYGDNSFYIVN